MKTRRPVGQTKNFLPNPRGVSDLRQRVQQYRLRRAGLPALGGKTGAGVSAKMAGTFVPELSGRLVFLP